MSTPHSSKYGLYKEYVVFFCIMKEAEQPIWAVTPEKVREAVKRLADAADPVRVIMFGSQARGEGNVDSDLDLIVVEREVSDRFAEIVRLRRTLKGLIMGVDILVISEEDFAEWSETPGSVYYTALREGKVLYEAA